MEPYIKTYSSIAPKLLKKALFRGIILALTGMMLLFATGTFLNIKQLEIWGLPIFILSFTLVVIGLLPYKRLLKKETVPDTILLKETVIQYQKNRDLLLTIPILAIKRIAYKDIGNGYGIAFWFTDEKNKPMRYHQKFLKLEKLSLLANNKFACDVFLPYFTEKSCKELESFLTAPNAKAKGFLA